MKMTRGTNRLLRTTATTPSGEHHMQYMQPVLLKMGIWMPETCRDIYDKSQLLHQVGTSRHFESRSLCSGKGLRLSLMKIDKT